MHISHGFITLRLNMETGACSKIGLQDSLATVTVSCVLLLLPQLAPGLALIVQRLFGQCVNHGVSLSVFTGPELANVKEPNQVALAGVMNH